ncbi:MAG: hypothetical protein V3U67_10135 [Gemmatimonadota bacterium]
MVTTELTSRASSSWLNHWSMPFWWIILAPIVTVPLSAILFSTLAGYHSPAEVGLPDRSGAWFIEANAYSEVVPTLIAFTLPGLLNLAPFIWTLSAKPRVRMAGALAGLLGLVRLGIPLAVLMLGFDRLTNASGTSYFDFVTEGFVLFRGEPHDVIWFFGALVWLGTLLMWASFLMILYVYEQLTGNTGHGKEGI